MASQLRAAVAGGRPMAERCEWCGARGGVGHTFEAEWRQRHYAGPAELVTWQVCNEQCEARLREHLRQTIELGFPSYGGFLLWMLKSLVLWVGVPALAAWGVAAAAGAPAKVVPRIVFCVASVAMGVAFMVWFYPVPIWANIAKPSSTRLLAISIRSAERLCRLGAVAVLLVMVASGIIVLLLPE